MANALKWTSEKINAYQAAAHLVLAHGDASLDEEVTIGFIDDGILATHETFDYVDVTEELLAGAVNQGLDESSHGTSVASIAVGSFVELPLDSPDLNINVKMFAIPLGDGSGPYRPITLNQLSAADFGNSELYSYVLNNDLDILNLSFGYSGSIEGYSEQDLRNNYSKTIATLAQAGSQEKTILVWAAGNAGGRTTVDGESANYSSPGIDAGLVARVEELQGHSIAVVSIGEDGGISDFSNRCGIAADFCIAAPGELVPIATKIDFDGDYYGLSSGTSFAAPMVSGGLIALKKLFRDQLSNEELVSRLFSTANDDGIYANSAIYGHGLMDLGAATNPWGTPSFMGAGGQVHVPAPAPTPCINTTEGCLTQGELTSRKNSLASAYRSWGGPAYRNSHFLDRINADDAYGYLNLMRGISYNQVGSGVNIGIFAARGFGLLDSKDILESHETLRHLGLSNCMDWRCSEDDLTGLASVTVGRRPANGSRGMFGVAPGASLAYVSYNEEDITDHEFNVALQYLLESNDSDILIIPSWGKSNKLDDDHDYSKSDDLQSATLRNNIIDTIFVTDVGQSYEDFTLESLYLTEDNVAFIMSSRDNSYDTCANRINCITVPYDDFQLAADDTSYLDSNPNSNYQRNSYTNLTSGIVGGGLAVMKQMFRSQLSNTQLVDRLLATAYAGGKYSGTKYGHGLMDLGAATNPWGVPEFMSTLPSTSSDPLGATDVGTPITSTFMTLGAPLGDGLSNALTSQEIAAFDVLGAPFWFQAGGFTVPSAGASVAARLQRFLTPIQWRSLPDAWQFNLQENAPATETGHLALTDGASRFTVDGPQGVAATVFQEPGEMEGLTLAWTPTAFSALTMEAGYLNEQNSLLGSEAKGAFGSLAGETLFLGAGLNATTGSWQLTAQGELGQVTPSVGQSQWIDGVSSLSTSSFRLQATHPFAEGSTLSFSLSQPLRVESGSVVLSLPTGRTQDGVVLSKALSAPLAPSGRQLDLTTKLQFPWLGGDVSLGATRSGQPQHQQTAVPEWTLFTGYRSTW